MAALFGQAGNGGGKAPAEPADAALVFGGEDVRLSPTKGEHERKARVFDAGASVFNGGRNAVAVVDHEYAHHSLVDDAGGLVLDVVFHVEDDAYGGRSGIDGIVDESP